MLICYNLTVMQQLNYWTTTGANKIFSIPFHISSFKQYVKEDSCVLDVGCGYGRILNLLNNNKYINLWGTDISETLIKRCKENVPIAKIKSHGDSALPLPDDFCDALILVGVLTCLEKNINQSFLMKEIKRV